MFELLQPTARRVALRHSMRVRRALSRVVWPALLLAAAAESGFAQSAQPFSFQFSALSTTIRSDGSNIGGVGVEPQLRFNQLLRSEQGWVVSLGVGAQYTSHSSAGDELDIQGGFVEPRWVPNTPSDRWFPYVSGRFAVLRQTNNFGSGSGGLAYGAGGGVALFVSRRVNLDAGVAILRQQFSDFVFNTGGGGRFDPFTSYAAKIGVSVGFPTAARQPQP